MKKKSLIIAIFLGITMATLFLSTHQSELKNKKVIPLVAIANYGPHNTLNDVIKGLKEALYAEGFIEGKNIRYTEQTAGFDPALISAMITAVKHQHPNVVVALTTPVAQFAKSSMHDTPIVFTAITDPVASGLIHQTCCPDQNITGASDQQNLSILLQFAKLILPKASRIGLLYAPSEVNDLALKKSLEEEAKKASMNVVAIPITHPRDIPLVMARLRNQVDFIYVGTSGPIQPALPMIAARALSMHIPVFNVDQDAVRRGEVLASFGVDYIQVGKETGRMVAHILKHPKAPLPAPTYPTVDEHHAVVNLNQAQTLGITLPDMPNHVTCVK